MTGKRVAGKQIYRTVWLSDVHLGSRDCHADYLISFLQNAEMRRLYLVGDIIDILAMKKRLFWPPSHYQVLKLIHEKAQNGTKVIYVPGNHDASLREFVDGQLLNIDICHQYVHLTAAGKRLLVMHGDELDHAILYRRLNRIVGDAAYDLTVFFNRWINRFRRVMRLPYWSFAEYLKTHVKKARETIDSFEWAAAELARSRGMDGVVCGHIHKAAIKTLDGILYCNDGDWTESCTALVETFAGELELLFWASSDADTAVADDIAAQAA